MTQDLQSMMQEPEERSIDLLELAGFLLKKAFYLFVFAVAGAIIAFAYTARFVDPTYMSDAMLYVNNSSISFGSTAVSISGADISTSRTLVSTYAVILKNRETLEEVIEKAELSYDWETLNNMITASSVNNTEIMQIKVTGQDPIEAAKIANTIVDILPNRISQIVDGSSVKKISGAIPNRSPISPSIALNTLLGAAIGFAMCAAVLVWMFLLDTQIHSENYLMTNYPDIPVLVVIPPLDAADKKGYGYGDYSSSRKRAEKKEGKEQKIAG